MFIERNSISFYKLIALSIFLQLSMAEDYLEMAWNSPFNVNTFCMILTADHVESVKRAINKRINKYINNQSIKKKL